MGLFAWKAMDEDPHFVLTLGRVLRPRHLLLLVDGLDARVETTIYFDWGAGFEESRALSYGPAGRALCWLELDKMPQLRRIRLDPSDAPGRLRVLAVGSLSRLAVRWLLSRLNRDRAGFGPTRTHRIASRAFDPADLGTGRDARRYRSTAEHYADVLAMAEGRTQPPPEPGGPLISFLVPTYDTDPAYLDTLLASFMAQPQGLAELILSDDGSKSERTRAWLERHGSSTPGLKVVLNPRNQGIAGATNAALQYASAPWISLADHDDALSPGAVAEIVRAIRARSDALFIYTDEVVTDGGMQAVGYMLKPAYDPVLLSGVNYINHLSVYRRDRLLELGGFRDGFQGSQDYDLLLRYLDGIPADKVLHLPYPAYLWRRHEASFSTEFKQVAVESARRALGARYGHAGRPAEVGPALLPDLHRVRFDLDIEDWPTVSVVIPNRDSPRLMATVLEGLASKTDYPHLEIVVADNDSRDPATLDLYAQVAKRDTPFILEPVAGEFNFSRSINTGLARATGDLILLLNNDIEMEDAGWLKEMVSCFRFGDVGIVGARLLYPDRTLQHAGVIVGLGGLAGHWFGGKPETFWGPMGRLAVRQSMSAVTGAAMLVSRACFDATGGFDEDRFAIAYNDVDFCLRAGAAGFRVVWTPFATLIHHESASRGSDEAPEKIERFMRERKNLRERHGTQLFRDPAYNPWHDTRGSVPGLRALDELPDPR
jgi:GT2 family glycosyltransferase